VKSRVLVVGGSLVGMSTALAMSKQGSDVTVLERSGVGTVGGGGLGVDVSLLQEVTGLSSGPAVYSGPDRDTTAWHLLREWLEVACSEHPLIRLHHDAEATDVSSDSAEAVVASADGRQWAADVVVGADGVHSTVRRFVDASRPSARYAGYLLWRAMVSEEDLVGVAELLGPREPSRELFADRYRLVTYLVPGPSGDVRVGQRRLNLVWYDPAREELLRSRGLLTGDVVLGSLSAGDLPDELSSELRGIAEQTWPSPWNEALGQALERRLVFGTPVAEYLPQRLVSGRVALVGDAAHAATPMVGGGFRQGLYDAAQLATALRSAADVPSMLASHQAARLEPTVQHVLNSIRASRAYLSWAGAS
jgi:2-polyprenyl-6-methoxyphenol hydroxylase-like FAD-dependent oxidoreductase